MSSDPKPTALDAPQKVLDLLDRLHKRSLEQEEELKASSGGYENVTELIRNNEAAGIAKRDDIMRDKFIALDADKACFVYNLIRATGALNVLECGTSFGVSTIYLALAVGQNAKAAGKQPGDTKVTATEFETSKAAEAREYWKEAGESVEPWTQLREGDLLQTLKKDLPTIDFVLFDIWTPMVVPTLEIIEQHFRPGTVLICDNVTSSTKGYEPFFERIKGPNSKYRTLTLPFSGGLEMTTYWP